MTIAIKRIAASPKVLGLTRKLNPKQVAAKQPGNSERNHVQRTTGAKHATVH
jgi:hypothetical protein